ncbi:MAG: hypothetical protein JW763_10185 [candidate division Zixibacteria bacterium]|nr:hypothetical protein [candidate division Zixibacteria bacterium]
MLTGIHFLLTYSCTYECDHCFLYCSPNTEGTFTIDQVKRVLDDAKRIPGMEWVYFEGGEAFMYYPVMLEGMRAAKKAGFKTGVVTNCYWATSENDAALWLGPLVQAGIDDLSMSDDEFHHGDTQITPAKMAATAAARLGLSATSICIDKPAVKPPAGGKGDPVIGGGALFKGRAADKLTSGLPVKAPGAFSQCLHEELVAPKRVHVDAFGNVQVCQGISIGNMWSVPLSQLIAEYDADTHPICGPLVHGGPDALAKTYQVSLPNGFVDECHYCFLVRRALLDRFPEALTPKHVYGPAEIRA